MSQDHLLRCWLGYSHHPSRLLRPGAETHNVMHSPPALGWLLSPGSRSESPQAGTGSHPQWASWCWREKHKDRCEKSKRSDKQQAADLDSAVWTHFSRSVFASISALASPGTSNLFVRVSDTSVLPISSLLGSSAGRGFSPECNRKQGIVNYWRVPDPWPAEWRQGLDSHRFRQTCCFHTNVPCQHILGQRKSKSQDMKTKMKTTEHWRKMFCGYVLRCSHAQQHIWSHLGIDSTLPTFKVL